jgi:hypothetical protein
MIMINKLGIVLGLIILIADLYWIATSYYSTLWLALGIIILVADIIWIAIDAKSR